MSDQGRLPPGRCPAGALSYRSGLSTALPAALLQQRLKAVSHGPQDPPGRRRPEDGRDPHGPVVRRSASGRIPQWAIDEALGHPSAVPTWRGDAVDTAAAGGSRRGRSGASRREQRRGWAGSRLGGRLGGRVGKRVGVAAVVLTLVAGAVWAHASGLTPPLSTGAAAGQAPSPGHEAADASLGQPGPPLQSSGAWRPLHTQADGSTPVAWDPCRPIHYVTRPDAAPAGAQELLTQAIARVSAATGLCFIDDGITTEGPSDQREAFQPERYGDRWAPVLVTYVSAAEVPDIAATVIAQAEPIHGEDRDGSLPQGRGGQNDGGLRVGEPAGGAAGGLQMGRRQRVSLVGRRLRGTVVNRSPQPVCSPMPRRYIWT